MAIHYMKTLPDCSVDMLDEDYSIRLGNLTDALTYTKEGWKFTYAAPDTDSISAQLEIRWQAPETVLFGMEVPYLGFQWDLHTKVVHLLEEKKTSTSSNHELGEEAHTWPRNLEVVW